MPGGPSVSCRFALIVSEPRSDRSYDGGSRVCLIPFVPSLKGRSAMLIRKWVLPISTSALFSILAGPAFADCSALPNWQALKAALTTVVAAGNNGGLGFNMWGTLVADDG